MFAGKCVCVSVSVRQVSTLRAFPTVCALAPKQIPPAEHTTIHTKKNNLILLNVHAHTRETVQTNSERTERRRNASAARHMCACVRAGARRMGHMGAPASRNETTPIYFCLAPPVVRRRCRRRCHQHRRQPPNGFAFAPRNERILERDFSRALRVFHTIYIYMMYVCA